jgi:hypothetical protein
LGFTSLCNMLGTWLGIGCANLRQIKGLRLLAGLFDFGKELCNAVLLLQHDLIESCVPRLIAAHNGHRGSAGGICHPFAREEDFLVSGLADLFAQTVRNGSRILVCHEIFVAEPQKNLNVEGAVRGWWPTIQCSLEMVTAGYDVAQLFV